MAQLLPADEDFVAPAWLTSGGNALPWHFWYVGFLPGSGLGTVSETPNYPAYPGGPLANIGRQSLFIQQANPVMPVLMTDTSGIGQENQRSVLCREQDSVSIDGLDYKVEFGLATVGGSTMGAAYGGSGTASPTAGGRYPFPGGDAADTDNDHQDFFGGQDGGNWTASSAGSMGSLPAVPANRWALWLGNSLYFRAGGSSGTGPKIAFHSSEGHPSRQWWVHQVDNYTFSAYPVVNAAANRVDLYLELWFVRYFSVGVGGVAYRLIRQVVDGGASRIDFSLPYFLRVTHENNGSGNVDLNAYIGQYRLDGASSNLAEAQCFKDGVFGNNTYTVGSSVSTVNHASSTGNVEDQSSNRISTVADTTFGWGMGRDRTINVRPRLSPDGSNTDAAFMSGIEGVHSVEVKNLGSGVTLYRDEFDRSVIGGAAIGNVNPPDIQNPIEGLHGHFGNQANGLFTFDAYAQEYGTGFNEVRRLMLWTDSQTDTTGGNSFVTLDYDADDDTSLFDKLYGRARSFIHTRPSTQFYNHHRSIEFRPGEENPSTTGPALPFILYEVSIMLRGSFDGHRTTGAIGRILWATDADNTITTLEMTVAARNLPYSDSINTSGATTRIAQRNWSGASLATFLSSFPLYDGNFHTLDFRAETYAAATSPEASAEYHIALDGVPIELNGTGSPYQSSTVSPYPIVESGPAYWSGRQEGFSFYSSSYEVQPTGFPSAGFRNYNLFRARNWTEGAMTDDPDGGYNPNSQASIVVGGEGAAVGSLNASSGALAISGGGVHDVEVDVTIESSWPIRRIGFESGHAHTSPASSKARRRWRVSVRAASLTVYQSLQSFYSDHDGIEIPFSFIVPVLDDGTEDGHTAETLETLTAWFASDELRVSEIGPQVYDISFSIEERLVP